MRKSDIKLGIAITSVLALGLHKASKYVNKKVSFNKKCKQIDFKIYLCDKWIEANEDIVTSDEIEEVKNLRSELIGEKIKLVSEAL